ncbi:MAG TPA: ABC transporter substrate-binding protein [Pilimelia sp.]|nr:ABC transporter substrate-binding protein [Pilimelia sp.]
MHPLRGALYAACAALLLTGAACDSGSPTGQDQPQQVRLYGSDGNMSNSFGDEFKDKPGLLAGMKGTAPFTPLAEDFKTRLRAVDPKLKDYLFAAETYDAVVISTLAAELAGTTEPQQIARYINGVTTGGQSCDTVSTCLQLARARKDLQFRGVSLQRGGFTDAGEPSTASYATLHFGRTDRLDDGKMEFVGAGDEATTTKLKPPAPRGGRDNQTDGSPLKIGGLLPKTGDLAGANPPMIAGALLAVKEVNAAGGVLGEPVDWVDGDDGTNPAKAKQTVASHVAAGVHVIIGAGASGVTRAVLPDVVSAGLILFSPSNTAADLSKADDRGLYFRTAPSDLLQGKALTDVIIRDGVQKIAIVARKDAYGEGLQANVKAELEKVGVAGTQILTLTYVPPEEEKAVLDFTDGASQIKQFGPDAILVIGFSESAQVIKAIAATGLELRH